MPATSITPPDFSRLELGALTDTLKTCARNMPLVGYESGKERIQSLVVRLYDCSARSALDLVDRLEDEGYVVATVPRRRRRGQERRWRFRPTPAGARTRPRRPRRRRKIR